MLASNKVAVVTGGANGIGLSCTMKFLQQDYLVICVDIDEEALNEAKEKCNNDRLIVQKVNVSLESNVLSLSDFVDQNYNKIDALINCVGIQTYGSLDDTTEHLWDTTFIVNVKSMFLMAKHFVPLMRKNGKGSIVNLSSVQSLVSQKGVLAYAASKGAINAFSRALAIDLADSQIRVNSVLPGSVDTPMLRKAADLFRGSKTADEIVEDWGHAHPIGRVGSGAEIAELIFFLSSESSSFITGGQYVIDGGLISQLPVVLPTSK
jgi:NAD(P)-dependent dehydrogenase (short-subunit alcohol dehydrogenase family)